MTRLVSRFLHRSVAALALLLCLAGVLGRQAATERTVRVTLLQLNDVYQAMAVDKGARGGLARVATLRKRIMADSPNTLFLLAGDTLSPSVGSQVFKGRQMIAAWNAAGLDFAALGNHEFDFGPSVLRERINQSRFVWLAANVIDKTTGKEFGGMPPFVIRELDGVRVGIFGLLLPLNASNSRAGPEVEFRDPVQTAAQLVPQMRAQGARIVIALTHLSMSQDKELAQAAPIDIIIGGHDHTLLQSLSGRTPIFKMGSDARSLGRFDLNIAAEDGTLQSIDWEVIPVTRDIPEESGVAGVIAEYEKQLSAEMDKPVGETTVELDARSASNYSRETNLGSFIADVYRGTAAADVALVNGGSIRTDTTYGPGKLSRRDIFSILPFLNPVVKLEVSGAVLQAALENGVSRAREDRDDGRFPQVSGLRYSFDTRRPAGSRLVSVSVNGQPLDDRLRYTLAISAYMLGGGDGYSMLREGRILVKPEEAQMDADAVVNEITSSSPIAPRTDGRIQRVD